ncbi:MAG: thioredoxin family protein [Planctomycetaceae bacterium]|nr:thioredoxin family protein [Planctomycetaceae bacterium]
MTLNKIIRRNCVLFYFLTTLSLILCVAGIVRYERNKKVAESPQKTLLLPNPAFNAAFSDPPVFYDNFVESAKLARQQEKPMLLLFTAKNCVYSRQMLETTFQADAVKPFLKRFILANVDVNQHRELCRQLNVEATPTIQFMSAQSVSLQRINGVTKPEELIACMNSTLQTITAAENRVIR